MSWNSFNERVLNEGLRKESPLLERLKFLAIVSSNYDEFFKVRVGSLMRASDTDLSLDTSGQRPSHVLTELLGFVKNVVKQQDSTIISEIIPGLSKKGLNINLTHNWEKEIKSHARKIFNEQIFPICTPIAVNRENSILDHAAQERICAAFSFDDENIAIVLIPTRLKRFHFLTSSPERQDILLLEQILLNFGDFFFPGKKIESRCLFRITQDADMSVNEERDEDFVAAIEEVLERRKTSFPVRIESSGNFTLANRIRELIHLPETHHFQRSAPLKFSDFFNLSTLPGFDDIKTPVHLPIKPAYLEDADLWEVIKERDVLLIHPYESYMPVVRMVEEAASDPNTISIKMTLYRTSGDSPIVNALALAAESGKQVTILVELKARFDEDANIHWAVRLKKAGAIVVYGLVNLKVHAKALLIVRKEEGIFKRYLHLGTGNYNEVTARIYTDISLMTCNEALTMDAAQMFNAITGYSAAPVLHQLIMAPFSLRSTILKLIQREIQCAKNREQAQIIAKVNSLVDEEIINALYEASSAGVNILLNVRGICCLRPGVPGLSENIRVISIIDLFLEHIRAFAWHNGGNLQVYLSSADWMTRNMDRRVEVMLPIHNPQHKLRIVNLLENSFKDNCRSWELQSDGQWIQRTLENGEESFRLQEYLSSASWKINNSREESEKRLLTVRRSPMEN